MEAIILVVAVEEQELVLLQELLEKVEDHPTMVEGVLAAWSVVLEVVE